MSQHTPGPWIINGTGIDEQTIIGTNALGIKVAVADCPSDKGAGTTDREIFANARLIAAAPELLEACETALANLAPSYSSDHLVIKLLRSAIAKVEAQP